jgi:hypothetical protein
VRSLGRPLLPDGETLITLIHITAGPFDFEARLEQEAAPKTWERFLSLLSYNQRIIHVRWSGEGCWIPLGSTDFGLGFENATSYPASGQFLLYPGGFSETELLLAYGGSASRARWASSRAIIS